MVEKQKPQLATAPLDDKRDKDSEKAEADLETRILELGENLEKEKSKSDDLFRRLQYLQADFENYRKRMEKEAGEAKRFGNERLLSDLLVVNDELELAVKKAGENEQNPVLLEGVEMVLKRLQNLLGKEGVERIDGVGSKFTPELHEAALRVSSDEEEGTIVEEIRPGYLLKGRVLRPSIVKVAKNESSVESEDKNE
jgi:molecular chaperone GrpE